ncbi:MAG: PKD domain-containing protein [Candidatus Bathyarchaeota archaeon]|nr:PKD domain-containing protein [Candidatus Bathyarchaeota archaeon]
MLVFAEAPSFARLDDIDPSGWFYQAVLYNPTDNDMVVTGLRWWANASAGVDFIDAMRNAKCYDSRYFSNLPTVWASANEDRTRWEYANGTISMTIPPKEIIVTWTEVPTNSRNNNATLTTYYVEACVGSQWISSPLYASHCGHDKIASTVFRADFNLTTNPNDERQNITQHNLKTPEWLFNEDRSVIANLSTRARLIPVTSSRNTDGIDYATVNVTLPSGWSYVPSSAYNPYGETITLYSGDGIDRLSWDLDNDVYRYSDNQSMAQNYIEFNVTIPYVPGICNFMVTSTITSRVESWTTLEIQSIYVAVKTPPNATFSCSPIAPLTGEDVTFNATGSYDLDGQIVNYFWDFGDGTSATGVIVQHAYVDDGNYTVRLTVTDDDGVSTIETSVKTILNRAPVASFVAIPQQPITGETAIFNASASYDSDGGIASYKWDFGDGNITTISSSTITHKYSSSGNYTATLTIFDNDNFSNSSTLTLSVHKVDIAIVDVIVSANEVRIGQTVDITIVVRNEGTINVTFNAILYANDTVIETRAVQDLTPNETRNLNFTWDTSSVAESGTYQVRAEVDEVQGETDVADNVGETVNIEMDSRFLDIWDKMNSYAMPIGIGSILILSAILGTILIKRNKHAVAPETSPPKEPRIFDTLASEVIPDAYSVMIVGDAGSGKSVFCQQLVNTYLKQGKPCIYVTYDCFPSEIKENMKSLGWNTSKYEQDETLLFVDCYSSIAGVTDQEKHHVEKPFELSELGIALSIAMEESKQKSTRIFLDSTVPLFTRLDPANVAEFLQDRIAKIKGENGVFFFTIGKGTVEHGLTRRLEEIVDCIIELDRHEKMVDRERRMRVNKLRGRSFHHEWISFRIEERKPCNF